MIDSGRYCALLKYMKTKDNRRALGNHRRLDKGTGTIVVSDDNITYLFYCSP